MMIYTYYSVGRVTDDDDVGIMCSKQTYNVYIRLRLNCIFCSFET